MMSKTPAATIDIASLLAPKNPEPARMTILKPKEAYFPDDKETKPLAKKKRSSVQQSWSSDEVIPPELIMKLVSKTPIYVSIVQQNNDGVSDYLRGIDEKSRVLVDDILEQLRFTTKGRPVHSDLSPLLHEVALGNWEDKIEWEGIQEEKKSEDAEVAKNEGSAAAALLAQPRNPELDNLVFDDSNVSWEGNKMENIERAMRIPLILELGTAGQSIARQLIPAPRPVPFDQTDVYMNRVYKEDTSRITSTAELAKGTLYGNKAERAKMIEERQKKRAQMAKDKTIRVTDAMGTINLGAGTGRTITSSLMGPGGTERTGRPSRGNIGATAHHDVEYIEQLNMIYNHAFSKPELNVVELREYHRPKLPLSFARKDRIWQFQIRFIPSQKKTDTATNPGSYMSLHAGSASQTKIRTEADLNPTEGDLVLLEYCEERPLIQLNKGMASKIVNYYRGDRSSCPVSRGGGDRPTRRKRTENEGPSKEATILEKSERPPKLKGPDQAAHATIEDWIGKIPKKKREEQSDRPTIDVLPEGVTEILHPKIHGPFLAEIEEGVTQSGLICNLFAAPLFRHEPESTDFLMILGKRPVSATKRIGIADKMSVVLRPCPTSVFTVGQVEPRNSGLVNAPQTTGEKNFLQYFVSYHIAKQLAYYEKHEGRGLRFDEIVSMWSGSGIQTSSLRQRIKTVAEYDKNTQIWESKPIDELDYPGVDALARKIPPEGIASYETACAATRRLQDIGIHSLYVGSYSSVQSINVVLLYLVAQKEEAKRLLRRMRKATDKVKAPKSNVPSSQVVMYEKACSKLEELSNELKRKHEVGTYIYRELCTAPWHLTSEFIDIVRNNQSTAQLELQGWADPSGGQGGYDFTRHVEKPKTSKGGANTAEGVLNAQIKKITGTDNDLRKLTMKQMGQILRSFGMPETKIQTLKRWDRVHVIRDYSTKAASDGIGDGLEKFARGEKLKLSEQRDDYRKRIQEVWRRQAAALSSDAAEVRLGGQSGDNGVEGDEITNAADESSPSKLPKEGADSDDSDDDDDIDDFANEIAEDFQDEKTGTQLLANHRREEGAGPGGLQRESSQDLAAEARDLAALRRQQEEDRAAADGIDKNAPARRSMIGKKVVRRRIMRTYPNGTQETIFKFILADDEIEKVFMRKREEGQNGYGLGSPPRKQIHKQNDRAHGHAMFEEDDNYELASTELPHSRMAKGRKGPSAKVAKRRMIPQAGKLKGKIGADKRMKKRKKEMEEAELYVPPSKRIRTGNNRRERGAGRQRLPHVIFSTRLEKIRMDVERFPSSGPFLRPVDRRKFPEYYEKIVDPIDLQTIRDKNQKFQFKSADAFLKDFLLMKNNAEKFNGLNHPLAQEANRIYDYVKHTIDAHREELNQMEADLQDMHSGKKKKKKAGSASTSPGQSGGDNIMIDGMVVGDLSKFLSDDSDSDDSAAELIEIGQM
jgi:transcription initiation factor TFIID subunit 1